MKPEPSNSMLPTYPAILTDNHLEWTGDSPAGLSAQLRVHVTLLDSPRQATPDQGARMAAALEQLAARGGLAAISNPLEWEREQRQDRELPGRES